MNNTHPTAASSESQIPAEFLQPTEAPGFPALLPSRYEAAELEPSHASRLLRRHPPRDVFVGLNFDVATDLLR